jgi:NADH-quinone oxidoreductase subunit N
MFIAIEILTISLYVMTAYLRSDKLSIEAGMKYLILGALASGFFLYGISFLYGATHSTHFNVIQAYCQTHAMAPMTLFALVLIFAAVGFKIAAVPFHMWVADVYQGAPTPVTALLSVGSKAAGFIVLIRLFFGVFGAWHVQWDLVLAVISAITMTYGNLVAMFQTNIKRLLAYSSISHAGYLLMGAAAGSAFGASGINFYLLGYLFTNLAAFLVIIVFSITIKSDEIADYAGLVQRSSLLACTMLLALVSLAGMPPLAGFFGKFILLMAVIKSGYVWLALIAGVNIVISLYYYLMVVKCIYVDSPRSTAPISVSTSMQLLMATAIIGIVVIGIFQGPFLDTAMNAVKGMYLAHP